jgi:transposase-like protein
MAAKDRKYDPEEIVRVYMETGNVSETARRIGCTRGTVQNQMRKHNLFKPIAGGRKQGEIKETKADLPKKSTKRYILTCAQNNVHVHKEFFDNLLALREHYSAELLISRITYNTNAYTAQPSKPGRPSCWRIGSGTTQPQSRSSLTSASRSPLGLCGAER